MDLPSTHATYPYMVDYVKYRFKRKPYKHQVAALKTLLASEFGGALLMEPRTGKTKVCVDYAAIRHQQGVVNRVLVVCPISVMSVWEDEIRANCPSRFRITVWDKRGRDYYRLPAYGEAVLDFVLVNYDAFSSPGRRTRRGRRSKVTGRMALRKRLRDWAPQMMILDESHRIKSWTAKRTSMVRGVAWKEHQPREGEWWTEELVPYRVLATGTAVTKAKRVFDLYSQWKFLNPNSLLVKDLTLAQFKQTYGVWANAAGYKRWLRNINENKLHRLVHEDSFAVARDECFDLPPRMGQIVHVDLDESAKVYDDMAEHMVAQLRSGELTEASIRLVLNLRLGQITSGITTTIDRKLVRIGHEKLDTLKELLSDLFEAEQKVVIGARWKADITAIDELVRALKGRSFLIRGGQNKEERDSSWRTFQKVDGPAALTMNPQAGGLGIDLSSAATMIWFSLTNSYVDFTQAEDRIALSRRSTTFMYLLARGTYDEVQLESLKNDGDIAKAVVASPERLLRNFKET